MEELDSCWVFVRWWGRFSPDNELAPKKKKMNKNQVGGSAELHQGYCR